MNLKEMKIGEDGSKPDSPSFASKVAGRRGRCVRGGRGALRSVCMRGARRWLPAMQLATRLCLHAFAPSPTRPLNPCSHSSPHPYSTSTQAASNVAASVTENDTAKAEAQAAADGASQAGASANASSSGGASATSSSGAAAAEEEEKAAKAAAAAKRKKMPNPLVWIDLEMTGRLPGVGSG